MYLQVSSTKEFERHIIVDTTTKTKIGYFWTDLLNGIEFHPRFGKLWDIKHFHSSRAGGVIIWNVV
jgi:hypothetical protein